MDPNGTNGTQRYPTGTEGNQRELAGQNGWTRFMVHLSTERASVISLHERDDDQMPSG